MGLNDIVERMAELISEVPGRGLVWKHDPWDRDDVANLVVSDIEGRPTLRAWWISGPTTESEWVEGGHPIYVARWWEFSIHGVEGLAPAFDGDSRGPGGDIVTLREHMEAVVAAIDGAGIDLDIPASVFDSRPCAVPEEPEHRTFADVVTVSYVRITKRVLTVTER